MKCNHPWLLHTRLSASEKPIPLWPLKCTGKASCLASLKALMPPCWSQTSCPLLSSYGTFHASFAFGGHKLAACWQESPEWSFQPFSSCNRGVTESGFQIPRDNSWNERISCRRHSENPTHPLVLSALPTKCNSNPVPFDLYKLQPPVLQNNIASYIHYYSIYLVLLFAYSSPYYPYKFDFAVVTNYPNIAVV